MTHAVWTGRFQPVHLGHLAVLRHSLAHVDLPHAVLLTVGDGRHSAGEYGALAADAYAAGRNPLTAWERLHLMRLALDGTGLSARVGTTLVPRHDADWPAAAAFYPHPRIICLTAKDRFETAKAALWRARGERVHVFTAIRGGTVLTTTRIRALVAAGADWRRYLPEPTHDYFTAIDGVRRVFGG